MKNKKFRKWFFLYLIINIALIYQIYTLSPLPHRYNIALIVILVLLFLVLYKGIFKNKSKILQGLSKFLLILLSVAIMFGNGYLYRYGSFLSRVSDAKFKLDTISIVVKVDSPYNNLEDVKDLSFGVEDNRESIVLEAIEDFEKQLEQSLTLQDYDNYWQLSHALLNNKTEVIIIDESYRNIVEDEIAHFAEDTKVIAQYTKKTEIIKQNLNVSKDTFSMIISGIDVYGPISNNSRTDVNILAVVNPAEKKMILVSIPRDYYLPMACRNDAMDKLTHTGIYGVDCTMDTIGNLFEIDVNYYTRVNFSSLVKVVDTIGGINVYNEYAFSKFAKGNIYLNGTDALSYVRNRYHHHDGDLARGRNQVKVLTAIIHKLASPTLITNFNSILSSLEGSFETNLSQKDISALVRLQIDNPGEWSIIQTQVDGTGTYDYSYALGGNYYMMYPNMEKVNEVKMQINQLYQ